MSLRPEGPIYRPMFSLWSIWHKSLIFGILIQNIYVVKFISLSDWLLNSLTHFYAVCVFVRWSDLSVFAFISPFLPLFLSIYFEMTQRLIDWHDWLINKFIDELILFWYTACICVVKDGIGGLIDWLIDTIDAIDWLTWLVDCHD